MLISVALCTYNGARHLRAQLESLLAQDAPELEIVVGDDASEDRTWAMPSDHARWVMPLGVPCRRGTW